MEDYQALETEALREPLALRAWLRLVQVVHATSLPSPSLPSVVDALNKVNEVYERALMHHPYSYKLWMAYIDDRYRQLPSILAQSSSHVSLPRLLHFIGTIYERALQKLPQMPLLWVRYLQHLMYEFPPSMMPSLQQQAKQLLLQGGVGGGAGLTKIRLTMLKALHALPFTQHGLVFNTLRFWCFSSQHAADIPLAVVDDLWKLFLASNNSTRVLSEYVKLLVRHRAAEKLIAFCCNVFDALLKENTASPNTTTSTTAALVLAQPPPLFKDPLFWELLQGMLLQSQDDGDDVRFGRCEEVPLSSIQQLLAYGMGISTNPAGLMRAHAVYLLRRGAFPEVRRMLFRKLEEAADPTLFQDLFSMLVDMEQQLVDCVALDSSVDTLSREEAAALIVTDVYPVDSFPSDGVTYRSDEKEPSSASALVSHNGVRTSPLAPLTYLAQNHALLLNAAQLRQRPHDVRLWLKRAECLIERAAEYRGLDQSHPSVLKELDDMFQQAITICSSLSQQEQQQQQQQQSSFLGPTPPETEKKQRSVVTARGAALLHVAWAELLRGAGRFDELVDFLHHSTFRRHHTTTEDHAQLFGMFVEALMLKHSTADSLSSQKSVVASRVVAVITEEVEQILRWRNELYHGIKSHHRGTASQMFGAGSIDVHISHNCVTPVLLSAETWNIAFDVVAWAEGSNGALSMQLVRMMSELDVYSPQTALLAATRLSSQGNVQEAVRCLEDACARCVVDDAVSALVLAEAAVVCFVKHELKMAITPRGSGSGDDGALASLAGHHQDLLTRVGEMGFPRMEQLRELIRHMLDCIPRAYLEVPNKCIETSFGAAGLEEALGLYGNSLSILQSVLRLSMETLSQTWKREQKGGAATSSVGEEGEGDKGTVVTASVKVDEHHPEMIRTLRCLETYCRRVVQHRGSQVLFLELSDALKMPLPPPCVAEIALRFTAQLALCGESVKARAVFHAVSSQQNPAQRLGALFWGAWENFERDFGTEESFISVQRTKRNVASSFSKSEVQFDR